MNKMANDGPLNLARSRKDVFPHEQRTQSAASSGMPQTGRPGAKRCQEHLGAHFLIVPFSSTVPSSDPVFLNDLAVMKHVELLSGVLASKHHDGLLPARVLT